VNVSVVQSPNCRGNSLVSESDMNDERIKNLFIFTEDESDILSGDRIQELVKKIDIKISIKKLKDRLETWGSEYYRGNGKSKYKYIKENIECT